MMRLTVRTVPTTWEQHLSPAQELLVLELRRLCLLPLDDLLSMTQRFHQPQSIPLRR